MVVNQREAFLESQDVAYRNTWPNGQVHTYQEQDYWCRNESCKIVVRSKGIPFGWYIVKKSEGPEVNLKTVALACSLSCLVQDSVREMATRLRRASESTY